MTSTTMTHLVRTSGTNAPTATFPGIPFARLVRVEWGKATDTRAARWLLIAVAATTVGLMLAPILSPSSIEQSYTSYFGFAAVALSILLPVVSILTLTSEWSQHTALATFVLERSAIPPREQMTQWNTARPEWRFRQLKEFTRNSQRAVHRLANPFGPLRLK